MMAGIAGITLPSSLISFPPKYDLGHRGLEISIGLGVSSVGFSVDVEVDVVDVDVVDRSGSRSCCR